MHDFVVSLAILMLAFASVGIAIIVWLNVNLRSRKRMLRQIDAKIVAQKKRLDSNGILQKEYERGVKDGTANTQWYARAYDGVVEELIELRAYAAATKAKEVNK